MNSFDLFDLTGLPFDPPEKNAKKVKKLGNLLIEMTKTILRFSKSWSIMMEQMRGRVTVLLAYRKNWACLPTTSVLTHLSMIQFQRCYCFAIQVSNC